MPAYETSATVDNEGQVLLPGVPFAPGTKVEIKVTATEHSLGQMPDEVTLAAARKRMQELFETVKGFRNSPKIPREELYERGSLR